jgi:hypothetical protein
MSIKASRTTGCKKRNRSRGGARKMKIDLDAEVRFRPKYLHEQNTAGTRS